ncbi:hypothetical protein HPB52_007463 [Rhipicephalus sanguineus]|uniref:Dynein axonemal assembly factor 1 homolog n=1 Tax=Rhipicephalus sanguineus TaxID=34632 RepID=A0A9D4PL65_RHISA|nr:hypothetical protein HPB52_007463 [Rhipicephalus sanguineus]
MSNRGLKKLEKRDGVGIEKLFLDHNELSKLDNIDCFLDVQKLSASHNQITRMYSLARLSQLSSIDLSNNLITCIEALKDLKYLVSVNLSNNRIKSLQSIQYSTTLVYLDLSGNLIPSLIDLTSLTRLKVSFLSHLSSLESFSIGGNPCVNMTGGIVGIPIQTTLVKDVDKKSAGVAIRLRVLDDFVVTQRESLKAEWLYSQGKGRCFHLGDHLVLVEYLSQVCPLTGADQGMVAG